MEDEIQLADILKALIHGLHKHLIEQRRGNEEELRTKERKKRNKERKKEKEELDDGERERDGNKKREREERVKAEGKSELG